MGGVRRASWRGSADSRANFAGRKAWPKPLGLPESEVAPGLGGPGGGRGHLAGKVSRGKRDSRAIFVRAQGIAEVIRLKADALGIVPF